MAMTLEELDQLQALLGIAPPQNQSIPGLNMSIPETPVPPQRMIASQPTQRAVKKQVNEAAAAVPESFESKMRNAFEASQRSQKQSLADLQNSLNDYLSAPSQVDLSALMALSDQWTGGKMAQNYKAPQDIEDRFKYGLQIQDLIAKRKNDMAQGEIDLLEKLQRHKDGRQDRFELGQIRKNDERIDSFLKGIEKEAANEAKTFNVMDQAFRSGSYSQIISSLANYARAVSGEKGVLTDQDIQRIMPKNYQGGVAKFLSYFNEIPTSELPANFTSELQSLLNKAKTETSRKYKSQLSSEKSRLAKMSTFSNTMRQYGGELFNDTQSVIDNTFQITPPTQGSNNADQSSGFDPNAAAAELKRRGK